MFSRTGSADFPLKLKALVTGPPKSGKTTLLGTIPNIVIADTEPHANNLQSLAHLDVPYITVNQTLDLQNLRMVLSNPGLKADAAASLNMPSIDAVAIDTLDTLQKIMKRERLVQQRSTQFQRDDWGWLKEEMTKLIEGFTQLDMHVIFTVHTKTKDVGTEKNPRSIYLPGLEGAISEEIAGMVGYSLLSFRKEEIDPATGKGYTKYWLKAEGDETYEFVGNRAAGRLPAIIEPDFGTIMTAALANRPTAQHEQVALPQVQTTGQIVQGQVMPDQAQVQQQQPVQPAQQPADQQAAQGPGQPQQSAQQPAQPPQQPVQQEGQQVPRPSDDDPINAAAVGHVKKVYDACNLKFPETAINQITIGKAREIVRAWVGIQNDHTQGKAQPGTTPQQNMTEYLGILGLLPENGESAPEAKRVQPKVDGNIDEVKAYVGEDLARAQEAFDLEAARDKPRSSLVTWLEGRGARPRDPLPQQPQVQTPVQTQPNVVPNPMAQQQPQQPVTQPAQAADAPSEEQAVQAVEQGLGGSVVEGGPCATCGKPIDDEDIASLSQTRFGKRLCVDDYILASRA